MWRGRVAATPVAAAGTLAAGGRGLPARLSDPAGHDIAMPRYKLTVEYDGGGLVGWQRQANGLSIQEALEIAVERFCGASLIVYGAGRTDAGVHALAQVAHVDLPHAASDEVIRSALNHHLRPHRISVLKAEPVSGDFDARLSAIGRVYRYRILNRRAPPGLDRGRVWHIAPPLN